MTKLDIVDLNNMDMLVNEELHDIETGKKTSTKQKEFDLRLLRHKLQVMISELKGNGKC